MMLVIRGTASLADNTLLQPCSSSVVHVHTPAVGQAGLRAADASTVNLSGRSKAAKQGLTSWGHSYMGEPKINKMANNYFEFISHPGTSDEPENVDRLAFFQKDHQKAPCVRQGSTASR